MSPKGQNDYVCVGQFAGPHGLKGAIRLKSFTEEPGNIKGFKSFFLEGDYTPLAPKFSGPAKGGFIVTLKGVSNPEAALPFKGKKVFVQREDLKPAEEGEFYLADLEGLNVKTKAGEGLGKTAKVYDFGAGPILEIDLNEPLKGYGKTLMIPLKGNAVTDIKLADGYLTIDLETWLEGDKEE
jgi:16S rRNA processing protein RimM